MRSAICAIRDGNGSGVSSPHIRSAGQLDVRQTVPGVERAAVVEERGLDFAGAFQLDLTVLATERAVFGVEASTSGRQRSKAGRASVGFDDLVGVRPDHAALARAFREFVPPVLRRREVDWKDDRLEQPEPRDVLRVRRREVGGRRAAGRVADDRDAAQSERVAEAAEVGDEVAPVVRVLIVWLLTPGPSHGGLSLSPWPRMSKA